MKFILKVALIFSVVGISASCSVKKDQQAKPEEKNQKPIVGNENVEREVIKDSDFDQIADSIDTNPFVADVPSISVSNLKDSKVAYRLVYGTNGGEKAVSLLNADIKASSTLARILILKALRNDLATNSYDLSGLNDENTWNTFSFNLWKPSNYIHALKEVLENENKDLVDYSGTLKISYNLNLENLDHVESVNNLIATARFLDIEDNLTDLDTHVVKDSNFKEVEISSRGASSVNTLDYYDTHFYELEPDLIEQSILDHKRLAFSISDFKFTRLSKRYNYQDYVGSLKENLATIIISDAKSTKRYFVVSGDTILSTIKKLGFKVEMDSNESIAKLNDYSTTVVMPEDIRNPDHDFLNGNILRSFNFSSLLKKTVPGQVYIVVHATGREVFDANKEIIEYQDIEFEDFVDIENLREGDLLEVILNGQKYKKTKSTSSVRINGNYSYEYCEQPDGGWDSWDMILRSSSCDEEHASYQCDLHYSSPAGFVDFKPVYFSSDIGNYFIQQGADQIPFIKAGPITSFNSDNNAVLLMSVTKEMLKNRTSIRVLENDLEETTLSWGFEGYPNCRHRNEGYNNSIDRPDLENVHHQKFKVSTKTKLKIKRIGAIR